jgi:hypothetical protein
MNLRPLWISVALCVSTPLIPIGCKTAPSERMVEVQTLKTVGAGVDAAMKVAAMLYTDRKITTAQWQRVADFHDQKFQPAYNLAVAIVRADLSSAASPDLVAIFSQLLALVDALQK